MSEAATAFRLFGTTQVEVPARVLSAGKLTAQLVGGNLRTIRYDGVEVLRAISYLVRDRDWGTYDPHLSDIAVAETEAGFTVSYTALCEGPDRSALEISASIQANDGALTFRGEAFSPSGFETNRCGFCILHPVVGVAGTSVDVEHVDGTVEVTGMPDLIEPWQPFKNMRAITHTALPGVSVECRMEGDAFEMEDQRNWSDASYKTYVRPLALPWPYRIAPGERVLQHITLKITDARMNDASPTVPSPAQAQSVIHLTPGDRIGRMPCIGLIITPDEAKASLDLISRGSAASVQDLLFHFDPTAGHGIDAFSDFAAIAERHKGTTVLEIAVPCERPLDEEMGAIAADMAKAGFKPHAVMVCPSVDRQSTPPGSQWPECPPLETVYAAASKAFSGLRVGGGMLSYFTELNRKRVPGEHLDFVSHCTNPIVHAADDASVMQTLEALPYITRSVRAIYGDKPYRIGPSTIPMRQNPYGNRTMENPRAGRVAMANSDPRHNALFGAAFAMGYAIRVLDAGLESLTLAALTGRFGLIAGAGEPVPAGGERPLAHVVRMLAQFSGKGWRTCVSSHPDRAPALIIETGKRTVLLAVNITARGQNLDLSAFGPLAPASLSIFDEDTMAAEGALSERRFAGGPLSLPPFALARIEF